MEANRIHVAMPGTDLFKGIAHRTARADLGKLWAYLAPQYLIRRQNLTGSGPTRTNEATENCIKSADTLLLLGSNDATTLATSLRLFQMNPRLRIVCSGKGGHRTVPSQAYTSAEAEINARALMILGVPYERILIEPESENTGSNIINSRALLVSRELTAKRVIIVQSPAAQLRANLCFERKWNEDFDWEYYISYPPTPPSLTTMRPKTIGFHLSYALREVARIINYSYNPRFDYQTKRPVSRHILDILSRYSGKKIGLSADALNKDPALMQSLMEYFGSCFEMVDRNFTPPSRTASRL